MKSMQTTAFFIGLMLMHGSHGAELGDVVYLKSGGRPMTVTSKPLIGTDGVQQLQLQWDTGAGVTSTMVPEVAVVGENPQPTIDKLNEAAAARVK